MTHTCKMRVNTDIKKSVCAALLCSATLTTAAESLTNTTFVAFDVETTGLSKKDRVIEIAAVKFQGAKEISSKTWLINPGIAIPLRAQAVHGITDAMVASSPSFKDVFADFVAFAEDSMLLAHNASYDTRMINQEIARLKLSPPPNEVADTLRLARAWFPEIKSHTLENVLKHLGTDEKQEHRALSDARGVMRIFIAGVKGMKEDATLKDFEAAVSRPFRKSRAQKPQ